MGSHTKGEVADRVARLCTAGLERGSLQQEVMTTLRRALPCDAWCIGTVDPATLMVTGSVGEGYPMEGTGRFFEIEYSEESANKFADLARRKPPAGTLVSATDGQIEDDPYWRDICQPAGLRDELRAALLVEDTCWGCLSFARAASGKDFTEDDVGYIAMLGPTIALGLRASLVVATELLADATFGPGLLTLDDELRTTATSPAGQRWLAELRESESEWMGPLPQSVYAVVNRLRNLEQLDRPLADLMPRVRVRLGSGQWLSVQASRLHGEVGERIAVILEPASQREIAPLIVSAYGLTRRESEVAGLILQGLSTKEIAASLVISPGTVNEHVKAIFAKTGVHSRRELVGRVYDQQYLPRLKAGNAISPNGWFRDTQG